MIHQMLACGHPLAELWMENLMGFLKAGAKRVLPKNVCETMIRDLLFAQQINRMKAHRLYREPNPNKKGYMAPDDAGPGAMETPIRLVGSASAAWVHAVDFKDHLEKLLDDVRHGETSRDNSFFVYKMLKQVPDADPPPYTTEELESEEELPRNLLAEREDAKVPGGGGGSGGEEALVLLDGPGIRKVAVLMAPADMSSAKAADLGVDAGELVVAGIHARSQDVRAKCKCHTPVCPTQ
eukprot:jgi/Tetstr1/432672/TSEL_022040.t1